MRNNRLIVANTDLAPMFYGDDWLLVAAAGYEPRCTHVVAEICARTSRVPQDVGRNLLLLEFESHRELKSRKNADSVFAGYEPAARLVVTKDSAHSVVRTVQKQLGGRKRLIVDYSSLSRSLYLSLVRLAFDGVELGFVYSVGRYERAGLGYPVAAVGRIDPVPGLEGIPYPTRPKIFVFSLGYDGVGTLALADKLEASNFVVFWADPGASDTSSSLAQNVNSQLIGRSVAHFSLNLRDVAGTASILDRLTFEVGSTDKVIFVPVGPKPHAVACALAAVQNEHATLLAPYQGAGGFSGGVPIIEAQGEIICTSVVRAGNDVLLERT